MKIIFNAVSAIFVLLYMTIVHGHNKRSLCILDTTPGVSNAIKVLLTQRLVGILDSESANGRLRVTMGELPNGELGMLIPAPHVGANTMVLNLNLDNLIVEYGIAHTKFMLNSIVTHELAHHFQQLRGDLSIKDGVVHWKRRPVVGYETETGYFNSEPEVGAYKEQAAYAITCLAETTTVDEYYTTLLSDIRASRDHTPELRLGYAFSI